MSVGEDTQAGGVATPPATAVRISATYWLGEIAQTIEVQWAEQPDAGTVAAMVQVLRAGDESDDSLIISEPPSMVHGNVFPDDWAT